MLKYSICLGSLQLRLFKTSLMDTSFNDNQNLPKTGNELKVISDLLCLEQHLETRNDRTSCLSANLPQFVLLAAVNRAIINFDRRWYEYSGLVVEKSLIWEFTKPLPRLKRDSVVSLGDCCSEKYLASKKKAFFSQK